MAWVKSSIEHFDANFMKTPFATPSFDFHMSHLMIPQLLLHMVNWCIIFLKHYHCVHVQCRWIIKKPPVAESVTMQHSLEKTCRPQWLSFFRTRIGLQLLNVNKSRQRGTLWKRPNTPAIAYNVQLVYCMFGQKNTR